MNLDFSNCKTAKDVEEVYKKSKKEIKIIKDFEKRVLEDEKEEKIKQLENEIDKQRQEGKYPYHLFDELEVLKNKEKTNNG